MTEKERYELIIDVLTEKVKTQGETIALQEWNLTALRERLEAAEFKLNEQAKESAKLERTPIKK